MSKNTFLTLGCPLMDIVVDVNEEFLKKYGLDANNAIAITESNNRLFEDIAKMDGKFMVGGCSLNTARTVQRKLNKSGATFVLGAIGNDEFGVLMQQILDNENVRYIFEKIENKSTGKCAVLLTPNKRSLCTDLAASKLYKYEFLQQDNCRKTIKSATHYYVTAFFLQISFECILNLAKHSKTNGKIFAFNLGAPFLCDMYKTEMKTLMPYVDLIFGNELEAKAFAVSQNYYSEKLEEILLFINDFCTDKFNKKRATVITRADRPVLMAQNNTVKEFCVGGAKNVKNTNAAGDAFVGGFMADLMSNKSLNDCVLGGIEAAKIVIQNEDCNFVINRKFIL